MCSSAQASAPRSSLNAAKPAVADGSTQGAGAAIATAPFRQRTVALGRVATLAAVFAVLVHQAAPVDAQNPNEITNSFSDYNVVPAGRALFYDFVTYNYTNKKIPDVQVTLKSSGAVDIALYLYCNPSWLTAKNNGAAPGPSNAIFSAEEDVLANIIFIDSANDIIRPPEARDPASDAYKNYVPAYNCSVVSNDPVTGTRFQIDVAYNYRSVVADQSEQDAMLTIWNSCCKRNLNSSLIDAVEGGDGTGLDNDVTEFKCGRWAQVNDLYAGDAQTPWLDFCQVAGNQCTAEGRIFKLDLSSFGLTCDFPIEAFAAFDMLESLDLSDNFELTGAITDVFETTAGMPLLQLLDLSDVSGLEGPLVPAGMPEAESGLCKMAFNRLLVLNMAEIGLVDSELPACIFSSSSTLQELRLEFNQLAGSIPDVFSANSPLRVLSALSAGLSGTIPASLGTTRELEVLDLGYNFLTGSIPAGLGDSPFLRYCYLMANNLTGAVPASLALHPALEALDVSQNRLTGLPVLWTDGAPTASINRAPLRNLQLSQNSFGGPFPKILPLLPQLTLLQMAHNKFTGALPEIPGMFGQLRIFNVSFNQLTGSVPNDFGACGVFTLAQINALGVERLQQLTAAEDEDQGRTLRPQPQVFDVSRNQLTGTVPSFMYANNVPVYVRPYVAIQYNKFTVRCTGEAPPKQLVYLADNGHLCPQSPPPGALTSLAENTVDAESTTASNTGAAGSLDANGDTPNPSSGGSGGGGGGLPAFATALITICVVAAVLAVVGWVCLVYYKARARGEPFTMGMLVPRRNRGFKQFNDLEMVSGMDPLGFGPAPPSTTHGGHTNAQMNGGGTNHPVRPKRGKGGFL